MVPRDYECSKHCLHNRLEFRCAQITSVCLANGVNTTDHLASIKLRDWNFQWVGCCGAKRTYSLPSCHGNTKPKKSANEILVVQECSVAAIDPGHFNRNTGAPGDSWGGSSMHEIVQIPSQDLQLGFTSDIGTETKNLGELGDFNWRSRLVQADSKATVTQVPTLYDRGEKKSFSESTWHQTMCPM